MEAAPIDAETDRPRLAERARLARERSPACARWAAGHGPIRHDDVTQARVAALVELLHARGTVASPRAAYETLAAADRLAAAGMWLVVHMTYARRVRLDGEPLAAEEFDEDPQGHTGGALNVVPAYVGYLALNALTGTTRAWLLGQGHTVAAIDAVNVLVGNTTPAHAERYGLDDEGLTRLVRDFYSYELRPDGRPASPLGSHVNAYTAGGTMEGGYLGFAELQWVHAPLPGERLVALLSDGALEEQRGSDWAPRWWRAEDSGLATPILLANGRRIDQRTTIEQLGGPAWLMQHLRQYGFDPLRIDGHDPAAFAWAILEMEDRLEARGREAAAGERRYPVPFPYAIAESVKGYGFPGAGTNRAHNLPLPASPRDDEDARRAFHEGARALWVPPDELRAAAAALATHEAQDRPRERDHALRRRDPPDPELPAAEAHAVGDAVSPMAAVDAWFCALVRANPDLRVRVGNPDELSSNRMGGTLALLEHRVAEPEAGVAESVTGSVITALNEEAVVGAALGNKGGLGLAVSYEAFAVKMLGMLRQEAIFARHLREAGDPPRWLSVPVIATSHTWENGKNELSHQDPTLAEALLGEMADTTRVLFPFDAPTAVACLRAVYGSRGRIACVVAPKREVSVVLDADAAGRAVAAGGARVRGEGGEDAALVAVGAYQLVEALRASDRLAERGRAHQVVALVEPGRFREPRDDTEAACLADGTALFDETTRARVVLTHTRPEPLAGALRPLDLGPARTRFLGFRNRGGTLDVGGMLAANACTWAHALRALAEALEEDESEWLTAEERAALDGERGAQGVLV